MKALAAIPSLLLAAVILAFMSPAYCKDQPYMEAALDYLNQAAAPAPQPSMLKPPQPVDRLGLLKSARGALNKAPSIYKGRKAKAQEYVDVAIDLLKSHQEAKAIPNINKAISEVREGIRIAH
jgi:hypothetical protein